MHVERVLIGKVAREGSIEELLARGIEADHFADPECKTVFESMASHVRRYHAPPSFKVVREENEGFTFDSSTDSIDFLIDKFIAQVKRRVAINGMRDMAKIASSNDDDQLIDLDNRLLELAQDVARSVPSSRVTRFSQAPSRVADYRANERNGTPFGYKMGLGKIDDFTMGIQPGEFVTIIGWQGRGKSTLLQKTLLEAYIEGKTILFFSLEMKARALMRKFDLMELNRRAKVNELISYNSLKSLTLTDDELARWTKHADDTSKAKQDIIVIDDVLSCTPDRVLAEISRHKPDICAIDYITLMEGPKKSSMWESVTILTRQMKMIAQSTDTAVYAVAQTNINSASDGAALENISFARSIGADSDIVLGLHQDDDMKKDLKMEVRLIKNRDGAVTQQDMYWDPSHMLFRPWQPHDQFTVSRNRQVREESQDVERLAGMKGDM